MLLNFSSEEYVEIKKIKRYLEQIENIKIKLDLKLRNYAYFNITDSKYDYKNYSIVAYNKSSIEDKPRPVIQVICKTKLNKTDLDNIFKIIDNCITDEHQTFIANMSLLNNDEIEIDVNLNYLWR